MPSIYIPHPRKSIKERFKSKCSEPDENDCIIYTGGLDKDGYGRFAIASCKSVRAHRWAYENFIEPIPKGMCVCHHCDNPSCVNPKHLWLGTNGDNTKDRSIKGRSAKNNLDGLPMKLLPNRKLNKLDIPIIRKLLESNVRIKIIAFAFSVSESAINSIDQGKTWYHV